MKYSIITNTFLIGLIFIYIGLELEKGKAAELPFVICGGVTIMRGFFDIIFELLKYNK